MAKEFQVEVVSMTWPAQLSNLYLFHSMGVREHKMNHSCSEHLLSPVLYCLVTKMLVENDDTQRKPYYHQLVRRSVDQANK